MRASRVRSCWRKHYTRQVRRALCSEKFLPPRDDVRERALTAATPGRRYRKVSSRLGDGPPAADARSGWLAVARQTRPTRDLFPDTPRELHYAATTDRPRATGAGCSRDWLLRSGRCARDLLSPRDLSEHNLWKCSTWNSICIVLYNIY